jgi:hypothetical protein
MFRRLFAISFRFELAFELFDGRQASLEIV